MKKFRVTVDWKQQVEIVIEAHSQKEAEELFDDKYVNDDEMAHYIGELMMTQGPFDEDWKVEPAGDDECADFTYDELVDEEEEEDEE